MSIDYIVVQAGGRGARLGYLTDNKPKALVPVENLPMIFHLFRMFKDKRFILIADYKKEVLREYLESFADVKYQVVDASGSGTCSGIRQAVGLLPEGRPFMLIWSDLILPDYFAFPAKASDHIGISQTFPCRWSYQNGLFAEKQSEDHGVAGLFIFQDKSRLAAVPESGELVRWMREQGMRFDELGLAGTREFGLLSEYEMLTREKCRPFNKITTDGDVFIKEPIDEQGRNLAAPERKWYETAAAKGVRNIPELFSLEPLKMELVKGKNIYEYEYLSLEEKRAILKKLADALTALHGLERIPADVFSVKEAYYNKTMRRLCKIRDLIPFADKKTIIVNGRECRNVFFYKRDLERKLDALSCECFAFIHGDCTFSNLMLKNRADTASNAEHGKGRYGGAILDEDRYEPVFIDPRGYFGYTKLYGDPNYDWAKLYYSVVGNYDRFNLKDFRLTIGDNGVGLKIASNQWEDLESDFFDLSGTDPQTIKLLHAVIWLSLTTYAWHDYDSVCGAFYNGLYHLEGVL